MTTLGSTIRGVAASAPGTLVVDASLYRRYGHDGGNATFPGWESSGGLATWEDAPAPALVAKRLAKCLRSARRDHRTPQRERSSGPCTAKSAETSYRATTGKPVAAGCALLRAERRAAARPLGRPPLPRRLKLALSLVEDQRSDLNAARISLLKSSGCSQAAKWPPLSTSLK